MTTCTNASRSVKELNRYVLLKLFNVPKYYIDVRNGLSRNHNIDTFKTFLPTAFKQKIEPLIDVLQCMVERNDFYSAKNLILNPLWVTLLGSYDEYMQSIVYGFLFSFPDWRDRFMKEDCSDIF